MNTLNELKLYFETFPTNTLFSYGISRPFSWRGNYEEVAFSIEEVEMSRKKILEHIKEAYNGTFYGYKGGEYSYNGDTLIHFEEDYGEYTDGGYTQKKLFDMIFNNFDTHLNKNQYDELLKSNRKLREDITQLKFKYESKESLGIRSSEEESPNVGYGINQICNRNGCSGIISFKHGWDVTNWQEFYGKMCSKCSKAACDWDWRK